MSKLKTSTNKKSISLKDIKHNTEGNTVFNHFHKPTDFMKACIDSINEHSTERAFGS